MTTSRLSAARKRRWTASNARKWMRWFSATSLSPDRKSHAKSSVRMRILLLNLYYPPDTSATAKMAATVVNALSARHDVSVLCGRPSYDPTERRPWQLWKTELAGGGGVAGGGLGGWLSFAGGGGGGGGG